LKNLFKNIVMKIIVLELVITLIIGFLIFFKRSNLDKNPQASLANRVGQLNNLHQYGRPVSGSLMWEDDKNFQELCAKYKASLRMAAFQTTLPDPLPGEKYNVALAADMLAGTVVNPGEIFSLNLTIGPYTSERGFKEGPTYSGTQVVKTVGGGVCKIATTMYNVAILANLKIVERRAHGMLVPYVPPGQDATVSYGNQDFKFQNDTEHPIIIWADTKGNTLYAAIYGSTRPPKVTWHHEILDRQKTRTIYRNNSNLQAGEEKVIIAGADGLTVRSWLTIEYSNGKSIKKELGIDHYKPMPRVVERGEPQ